MRRCGKRYATLDAAQRSKAGRREGAESSRCPFGCGGFHVQKPVVAPGPAKADRPRSPNGSVKAAVCLVLAGQSTVAQAARITGANPESVEDAAWATATQLVRDRDSETCLNCGHLGTDVHHRQRRGMGGTADPVIAFGMVNLALLCAPCHRLAHKADKPEMAVKGYRLETWQDPGAEAVTLFSEIGPGESVWLRPDGGYADVSPLAGAA
jgi:hypothetical protein